MENKTIWVRSCHRDELNKIFRDISDFLVRESMTHVGIERDDSVVVLVSDVPFPETLLSKIRAFGFIRKCKDNEVTWPSSDTRLDINEAVFFSETFWRALSVMIFSLAMNFAHAIGFFHSLHAYASHMLICGLMCTGVMIYAAWDKYISPIMHQCLDLWGPYLSLGVAFAIYNVTAPLIVAPMILMRHICTNTMQVTVYDYAIIAAALVLPQTWFLVSLLPIGLAAYVQEAYQYMPSGIVNKGIGITLCLTAALSWIGIANPVLMHSFGMHVFFHDALMLLAVFEMGNAIKSWARARAKSLREQSFTYAFFENDAWHQRSFDHLKEGCIVYIPKGEYVPQNAIVIKTRENNTYIPAHSELSDDLTQGMEIESGAVVADDVIVRIQSEVYEKSERKRDSLVPQWFYPGLLGYITCIMVALCFIHPTLMLPVASSLFLAACPCVFTISRPMLDMMLVLYGRAFDVTVRDFPRSYNRITGYFFDRTKTLFDNRVNEQSRDKSLGKSSFQAYDWVATMVSKLRSFAHCFVLTHQQSENASKGLVAVGFDESDITYQCTPEQKEASVRDYQAQPAHFAMMVGNGNNDIKAAQSATFSLAFAREAKVFYGFDASIDHNKDPLPFVLYYNQLCDVMSQLESLALLYNVTMMLLVGLYPVFTGLLFLPPSTSCAVMTCGSIAQMVMALYGSQNAAIAVGKEFGRAVSPLISTNFIDIFKKSAGQYVKGVFESSQEKDSSCSKGCCSPN